MQIKSTILFILLLPLSLWSVAQQQIEDSDVYTGKADIFASEQVRLLPGFRAYEGCDVHVYIDENAILTEVEPPVIEGNASAISSSDDHNWVHTTMLREETSVTGDIDSKARMETFDYYDGLGRFSQKVVVQGSPDLKDIVQAVTYDDYGRKEYDYLPYKASVGTGAFADDPIAACQTAYSNGFEGRVSDSSPQAKTLYEPSPLNRVTGTVNPGAGWQSNPTNISYKTNTTAINHYNETGTPVDAHFIAIQLYVTEYIDEDGNVIREFKDKLGQVVRKEAEGLNDEGEVIIYATSYVYDDFGLLRCVVPPKAQEATSAAEIRNELCYFYEYDERKRMIEKKLPGAGVVYMVYDKRDRLVMSQDASLREESAGKWLATLYDAFNRPVMTAFVTTTETNPENVRDNFMTDTGDLYESFSTSNPNFGYTFNSFPTGYSLNADDILTVNWYDDYSFTSLSYFSGDDYSPSEYNLSGFESPNVDMLKGMATGSLERVVKAETADDLADELLVTVPYYDELGRLIRTISDNHLGGKDVSYTLYNFAGQVEKMVIRHNATQNHEVKMTTYYEYDHQGRLLSEKVQMDESELITTLATNRYNDIGELVQKYLHDSGTGKNFNQQIDYAYNIRGWLLNINNYNDLDNDLFALNLGYDNPAEDDLAAVGLYNGNISQMLSYTAPAARDDELNVESDLPPMGYAFSYDKLNRLKQSVYADGSSFDQNKYAYDTGYKYDLNGNFEKLTRKRNSIGIDDLEYAYIDDGNRLRAVSDHEDNADGYSAAENLNYEYDVNGNMTRDPSKGIDVIYNYLNLPERVSGTESKYINHAYSASGTKLQKITNGETGDDGKLDYCGPFIYEDGKLKTIFTSEGRIAVFEEETSSGEKNVLYKFEYDLKDHLGNTRVVFGGHSGGRPEWVQRTDYYPFGLILAQHNFTTFSQEQAEQMPLENKFLYNGKEWQNASLGNGSLNWYDYGARFYDPALARWHVVDPKAHLYYEWSPYCYVGDNPMKRVDPDGKIWNNVVGGLVGALVEYGTQTAINFSKGQNWKDAMYNNIDFADVGVAGVEGAITSGGSVLRRVAISAGSELVKAAVDINTEGISLETDVATVASDAAIGTAFSVAGSKASSTLIENSSEGAVKAASSNLKSQAKNLTKANNVVKNGNINSKADLPREAFNKFNTAKSNLNTTQTLNNTIGKTNVNIMGTQVNVAGQTTKAIINTAGQGGKDLKDDLLK